MSDYKALVLINGRTSQIPDADSLLTGAGLKNSSGDLTITPAGSAVLLAAGKNLSAESGAGAFDFSSASGAFSTSTGTNTLSGNVVLAADKNMSITSGTSGVDLSGGSGAFKTTTGAVTIGPGAVTVSGAATFSAAGTALSVTNNASVGGNLSVSGNLTVSGTVTAVDSTNVLVQDNHLYLNDGYTTAVAQTGGIVVNYLPTATATTVNGAYSAGIAASSNPTVVTTGSATFAANDLVQISGSGKNDGLYEVHSHVGTTLTLKGIGTNATVLDFTQNQLEDDSSDGAAITKVTVSALRAGTDGVWEAASGSTNAMSFNDLASVAGSSLQSAYDSGATITTASNPVTINGTQDFVLGGSVDFASTSSGGMTWTSMTGAVDLQTTSTMTMRGGSTSVFGDDVAAWSFNGSGALSSSGMTSASITPSGALTLTGGAASALSTSAGGLTITSAAAATWSTGAGALTLTSAAAATWSTAAGALTLNGAAGLNLQYNGTTTLELGSSSAITIQSGVTLGVTGTGMINLPSLFQINGSAVSANVTATNLDTLTAGSSSNADALHAHAPASQMDIVSQTTTGLADGDFGYLSAANTWSKAKSDGTAVQATVIAVSEGTSGKMTLPGSVIEAAKFTTAGGAPSVGAEVFLAAAADDTNTGAGKLTAAAPSTGYLVRVGVCVDASAYAGSKTAKIIFAPLSPIAL